MVDSVERVKEVLAWCRKNNIEQCTVRPVRKSEHAVIGGDDCAAYVEEYGLEQPQIEAIHDWLIEQGRVLLRFTCGDNVAIIYDVQGQNIAEFDRLSLNWGGVPGNAGLRFYIRHTRFGKPYQQAMEEHIRVHLTDCGKALPDAIVRRLVFDAEEQDIRPMAVCP